MMFSRKIGGAGRLLVVGAGLLICLCLCPCALLGQHRGGGGGGINSGGGGLDGTVGVVGAPGLDEKDQLKGFHQAMALQATSGQSAEFRALVKSTEEAERQLRELEKVVKTGDGAAISSRAGALRQGLDNARMGARKFVEGFSAAQKTGLKDLAARMLKADADLGEQEKTLETRQAAGPELGKALGNFRKELDSLAVEMGIVESEEGEVAFRIPPTRSSVRIVNQAVGITTAAVISRAGTEGGENVFKVEATTDLTELQENLTAILGAQMNKGERCGEGIKVEEATLEPSDPASVAVVRLHYARWVCTRVSVSEMAEGNATVEVKLTAAVGANGELQIVPAIGNVQADKLLVEMVRSGELGAALREKVAGAVRAAVEGFRSALPEAAGATRARSVRFVTSRADELSATVSGEMRLSEEQTKALAGQIKERAGAVASVK